MMRREVQDAVLRFAEKMLQESGAGTLSVTWFGGEPLLGISVIETMASKLIQLAEQYGAKYASDIVTNG